MTVATVVKDPVCGMDVINALMLKRTKLVGIRQSGKASAVPAIPQPIKKAA